MEQEIIQVVKFAVSREIDYAIRNRHVNEVLENEDFYRDGQDW